MPLIPPPLALYGYVGQGAQIAVTIGLVSSGLVAGTHCLSSSISLVYRTDTCTRTSIGLTISASAIAVPPLFASAFAASTLVPANQNLLARQWARLYNTGKLIAPPLAATSAFSFFYAAYAHWCVLLSFYLSTETFYRALIPLPHSPSRVLDRYADYVMKFGDT